MIICLRVRDFLTNKSDTHVFKALWKTNKNNQKNPTTPHPPTLQNKKKTEIH